MQGQPPQAKCGCPDVQSWHRDNGPSTTSTGGNTSATSGNANGGNGGNANANGGNAKAGNVAITQQENTLRSGTPLLA